MDALFESAYNSNHRILWYRLTPYSADHSMALEAIGSPFSKEKGTATAEDFVRALQICSRTKLHELSVPGLKERIAILLFRFAPFFRVSVQKFYAYLFDYLAFPEFWQDKDQKECKKLSGYPILARVMSVIKETSIPERRAWQMPIGLLVWYDEQIAELNGSGKRFWCEGDEEELEAALQKAEQDARERENSLKAVPKR